MLRLAYRQAAPEAVKALVGVTTYLEGSTIDAKLRALVNLRVSQINGCSYCVDMHSQEARHAGETQQRLDCLPVWRETTLYTDRERAALAWAESVTRIEQTGVPDEVYQQVRGQFNDRELVDLTVVIGMMNLWNRVAVSFRQGPAARKTEKAES